MTSGFVPVGADWLSMREAADAESRSPHLVGSLRRTLPRDRPLEIHDLGCGTGAMARWVSGRLPGRQHWVLHDRDADLLALAALSPPACAADRRRVSLETRLDDVTALDPADLAAADLVCASALLDMLTADEVARVVAATAASGCPVLVALSVVGRVELRPAHPLDAVVNEAFNAHQRRTTPAGRLLGPDAVRAALDAFTGRGYRVALRPSPWRLGPPHTGLVVEWLEGWLAAAYDQSPHLRERTRSYAARRRAEAAGASLAVVVHHQDLLARPPLRIRHRSEG